MPERTENLALIYQEVLTATVRLKCNRQVVNDVESFRANTRKALGDADDEGRRHGYTDEELYFARLAAVAFLDETILNSQSPVFADWPSRPLGAEYFGVHIAGDVFYRNLERLMKQSDSPSVADVLEVYYLCLLLGFAGRYSVSAGSERGNIREEVGRKILRIRGYSSELSPSWAPAGQEVKLAQADPWIKRLKIAAVTCFALALLLFVGFKLGLDSGASDLRTVAAEGKSGR
jgi:type VI secretion system protein ImpK